MALADLTSPDAILAAIEEFDRVGRDEFLKRYGFGRSRDYELIHDGKRYDSKPIVGAAHGHQHPALGPLSHEDFNGGQPTIRKLSELGFEVVRVEGAETAGDRSSLQLVRFLELYPSARQGPFTGDHEAAEALRSAAMALSERLKAILPDARVRPSVGQGNWAGVPWIAVLDPRETNSTQSGTYPVILIPEDLRGLYITLAQGVTELNRGLGRRRAYDEMERRAERLRPSLSSLADQGFELEGDVDLGDSRLGRDYAASVIASLYVPASALPDQPIEDDMARLTTSYRDLLESGKLDFEDVTPVGAQVLCIYVGRSATANFETGGRQGWWGWRSAPTGLESLRPGDLVLFGRGYTLGSPRVDSDKWQSGALERAVVGRVDEPPTRSDEAVMPDELAGTDSYPWKFRFSILGEHTSVPLSPNDRLSPEVVDALRRSGSRGHGHLVPADGSPLLESYLGSNNVIATQPTTLREIAGAFWSEVERSGMQLNRDRTLAFFAAALSKPFVILTGQSGSGKTQLAKRLGEWCGASDAHGPRCLVEPVRPDWTGPEYLFGYPDALRPHVNGRPAWFVPRTLEFMLRAHDDPVAPYVLVLDEMNLAHVERYFADFLSGIESSEPVLPALEVVNGEWIEAEHGGRLPIPTNLIVVGTVNVDETTYLFSPKVLDRAFTFEFRVKPDDLDSGLRRPTLASAASGQVLDQIVRVVRDTEWHFREPHPDHEALLEDLRELHQLLSPAGLDFGHRVVFEALRFAALLHSMTGASRDEALDFITVTKVLPKIHGSRQRLQEVLPALIDFATGLPADPADADREPRLPLTKEKLDRMLKTLLDAQFVSFTE